MMANNYEKPSVSPFIKWLTVFISFIRISGYLIRQLSDNDSVLSFFFNYRSAHYSLVIYDIETSHPFFANNTKLMKHMQCQNIMITLLSLSLIQIYQHYFNKVK